MQMPELRCAAGQGDVDDLARFFPRGFFDGHALALFLERAFHAIAQLVQRIAGILLLLFRDFLEPREEGGHNAALAAEVAHAHFVQLTRGVGRR